MLWAVRRLFGLRPAPEFDTWLKAQGWQDSQAAWLTEGIAHERVTPATGQCASSPLKGSLDASQTQGQRIRGADVTEDIRRLHAMGYSQELARQLGGFSNFALSLSIICILAGGITSFHLGLCSVGGASIGLGWPLVGLFALAVAATMGQLASSFPTAGGLISLGSDPGWSRLGLGYRLV